MQNLYTSKIDIFKEKELREKLEKAGFLLKTCDHAFWRAQNSSLTVTFYKSGKIVAQGKDVEGFKQEFLGESVNAEKAPENKQEIVKNYKSWIGTDESGKGDYFGPLVIAGVLVEESNMEKLSQFGIQDSKILRDSQIDNIAPKIKENSVFSVVAINPQKYNELYDKFKNLNLLLAWGHARAIENILNRRNCENALSDKFGNESLIKNALMKKGKQINLEQRIKAEEDLAVAAASILARNEFVQRMKKLSEEYGINLPKGASEEVIIQAKRFVSIQGREKLPCVAKIHFKTTQRV
jgi:ribonuclease HIII